MMISLKIPPRVPGCFRALRVLFLLVSAISVAESQPYVIAGSDLLKGAITRGIPDEISTKMDGSIPGLSLLRQDEADLAVVVRRPGDSPIEAPLVSQPLGYFVVSVVVNEDNPLNEISLDRLAGIFGRSEEFDFTQWGDLGLSEWSSRGIQKIVLKRGAGLAQDMYRYLGLQRPFYKSDIRLMDREDQMLDSLRGEESAIGIMGRVDDLSGVKVLALAPRREETPMLPNPEDVHFRGYPLNLPVLLVYQEQNGQSLQPLLLSFFRDSMAQALADAGVVPLPPEVRSRVTLEMELGR